MVNPKHIFVSYRSFEVEFALKLAADLKKSGLRIWIDRIDGIQSGDDWRLAIQEALTKANCAAVLAILSPEYLVSRNCRDEMARADRLGIPIYPVLLRRIPDEDWPLEIERSQYIDFSQWQDETTYRQQLETLFRDLEVKYPRQRSEIPDLETSYLIQLIADLESWQGVPEYIELSGKIRVPQPVRAETKQSNRKQEAGLALLEQQARPGKPIDSVEPIPLEDIRVDIGTYPRFVIIGAPGAGKTTTIRRLAADAAHARLKNPSAPLPLFLRLPNWKNESTPAEFIRNQWHHLGLNTNVNVLKLLADGDIILFLDGLNEMGMSGPEKAQLLRRWMHSSIESQNSLGSFPPPKYLGVTCRAADYAEPLTLDLPIDLPPKN